MTLSSNVLVCHKHQSGADLESTVGSGGKVRGCIPCRHPSTTLLQEKTGSMTPVNLHIPRLRSALLGRTSCRYAYVRMQQANLRLPRRYACLAMPVPIAMDQVDPAIDWTRLSRVITPGPIRKTNVERLGDSRYENSDIFRAPTN
jgi:hypothetical protein